MTGWINLRVIGFIENNLLLNNCLKYIIPSIKIILETTCVQLVLMFICCKQWAVGCKIGKRWDVETPATSLHGYLMKTSDTQLCRHNIVFMMVHFLHYCVESKVTVQQYLLFWWFIKTTLHSIIIIIMVAHFIQLSLKLRCMGSQAWHNCVKLTWFLTSYISIY